MKRGKNGYFMSKNDNIGNVASNDKRKRGSARPYFFAFSIFSQKTNNLKDNKVTFNHSSNKGRKHACAFVHMHP